MMSKINLPSAIVGIVLILFSIFFLWQTSKIQIPAIFAELSPRVWPEIVLTLLSFCAVLLLLRSIREKFPKKEIESDSFVEVHPMVGYIAMIFCLFSSIVLWAMGFFVTVPLFLVIFMSILGVRRPKFLIMIPILMTAILWFLFTRVAYIPLPKGFGIFYKINAFLL